MAWMTPRLCKKKSRSFSSIVFEGIITCNKRFYWMHNYKRVILYLNGTFHWSWSPYDFKLVVLSTNDLFCPFDVSLGAMFKFDYREAYYVEDQIDLSMLNWVWPSMKAKIRCFLFKHSNLTMKTCRIWKVLLAKQPTPDPKFH